MRPLELAVWDTAGNKLQGSYARKVMVPCLLVTWLLRKRYYAQVTSSGAGKFSLVVIQCTIPKVVPMVAVIRISVPVGPFLVL
jgi:hypothetical protein